MDINTNTLQQQPAVSTPLKLVNTKQAVDVSVKRVDDAAKKAAAPLESGGIAEATKAKETKKSEDLQQAVSQLNDFVQTIQRNLQFNIDKDSGVMVVKVIDTKSAKVIRQIPTEETLKMARSLAEHDDKAALNIFSSRA
jgi:flagellar protein FlaG